MCTYNSKGTLPAWCVCFHLVTRWWWGAGLPSSQPAGPPRWFSCSGCHCTAAAAKSLQSCPTLCDPIDGSPPGSPIPGILQARTLEWVAIFFSKAWKWKVKVKSLSRVWLLVTPWTAAHQAPPSMGFSRQGHWSEVHCTESSLLMLCLVVLSYTCPLALSGGNLHFCFSLSSLSRDNFEGGEEGSICCKGAIPWAGEGFECWWWSRRGEAGIPCGVRDGDRQRAGVGKALWS